MIWTKRNKKFSVLREYFLMYGWGMSNSAHIFAWKSVWKQCVLLYNIGCVLQDAQTILCYCLMYSSLKDFSIKVYIWHTVCSGCWVLLKHGLFTIRYIGKIVGGFRHFRIFFSGPNKWYLLVRTRFLGQVVWIVLCLQFILSTLPI